jgi:methylenetetrahydrofolate dehydrogenase (NADP+)/methenyltetrahydrofolate cyclohydrolase
MAARLLDGVAVATAIRAEVAPAVAAFTAKMGRPPGLGIVLVGNDPASEVYVGSKLKSAGEAGLRADLQRLPAHASLADLMAVVDGLNRSDAHDGILVQSPLPDGMGADAERQVFDAVRADKDVDGFHPVNVGRMLMGAPGILPCTPHGIQELLIRSGNSPEGKHVVVVGRSNIVGKPIAAILMQKAKNANATVTICHSGTKDLPQFTKQADILITAMGRPRFIEAEMVKDGVVVIDVGMNRIDDPKSPKGYQLVGDVDYDPVSKKAKAITPVPGGVGPMTRAMLMVNTVRAAEIAYKKAQAMKH